MIKRRSTRETLPEQPSWQWSVLLFMVAVMLLGLLHTWLHLRAVRLSYTLSDLATAVRAEQVQTQALSIEASRLRSPSRLEPLATGELQMRVRPISPEQEKRQAAELARRQGSR